eukprot:GGOE01044401.1.p2 GENE.GGOE01044401.1~~GGOE01044401.1.p2  ORF type:complete len:159 (-),score=4.98 GGOE01044401.1:239-715(-)
MPPASQDLQLGAPMRWQFRRERRTQIDGFLPPQFMSWDVSDGILLLHSAEGIGSLDCNASLRFQCDVADPPPPPASLLLTRKCTYFQLPSAILIEEPLLRHWLDRPLFIHVACFFPSFHYIPTEIAFPSAPFRRLLAHRAEAAAAPPFYMRCPPPSHV